MTAARSPHVCAPHALTVAPLLDGSRSSMREVCKCGRLTTWIAKNDGAIVALEEKGGRK